MQVNSVSSSQASQTFGTRCVIGNKSAQQGLKSYGENISKGIYNAFKKLAKNDANDTFALKLGSLSYDEPNTYINMSYFDANNNLKSSMNFSMSSLKNYTTDMFSTLVSGTYKLLTESTHKVRNLTNLSVDETAKVSRKNIATINKLTKEFGTENLPTAH